MVFAFSISRFYLTSLSRLAAWMPPLVKGDKDIPFDQQRAFATFRPRKVEHCLRKLIKTFFKI